MRRALIAAVTTLEEKLARSTDQLWLEQTAEPSAADFSVYGLIERLVGDEGDAQMGTATPWLWEESGASRLRDWHARMAGRFPLHFLGKESECKVWVQ
jgi:glutathione S-transferase